MGGFIPENWNSWVDDLGAFSIAAAGIGAFVRFVIKPVTKMLDLIHDTVTQLMTIAEHVNAIDKRVSKLEQLAPEGDNT